MKSSEQSPSKIILGSASPRRVEILQYFSLPFMQLAGDFDEESVLFQNDLGAFATKIAVEKAKHLFKQHHPDLPILTADTVVFLDGKTYGKPKNEQEAEQFLFELQGKTHTVLTAMALFYKGQLHTISDKTYVKIFPLDKSDRSHYLKATKWSDKAGGYAIQGSSGIIVEEIQGCYTNVMGLSIKSLHQLLKHCKINLWDYLK